jgi:hypothetical protein
MTSWQQESLLMRMVLTCTSTFPCILLVQFLQVQEHDGNSPLCAADLIGTEQA